MNESEWENGGWCSVLKGKLIDIHVDCAHKYKTHIVRWCGWVTRVCLHICIHESQTALWLLKPPSAVSETLAYLTALLEHTMTSCPLNAHLCCFLFSLGPLTGCFVPRQIYSSWLPYRALGKWDTNATVSAVALLKTSAVARGNKTAARTLTPQWFWKKKKKTTTNQDDSKHTAELNAIYV